MIGALAGIFFLAGFGASAAAEGPSGTRFVHRTVRIEGPVGAVVYRLDVETGEICAFSFERTGEPRAHDCIAGTNRAGSQRYALEAVAGTRGTTQSSAFRLDRVSGEVCRFRLVLAATPRLELAGCVGRSEETG